MTAPSSEPAAGESLASSVSNSEDVPADGKPVKDNVKAPPQIPRSTTSSNPLPIDDTRPSVLIRGKLVEFLEAYPKGAEG